ncbi:MAG: response regulator [Anaerolineales bacterium]
MASELIALVVEDNEDLNAIFSSALEKAGYTSQSVFDGAAALRFLSEIVPAMVILDLHMPKVGGDVVLKNIRSDSRLDDTTVIVVTADHRFAEALQLQKEMLLLKPVSFSQLSELASRFVPKQGSLVQ